MAISVGADGHFSIIFNKGCLEVEAYAEAETYAAALGELVEADVVVDGGLYAQEVVDVVAVAHLGTELDEVALLAQEVEVIVDMIGVLILEGCSEEDTILGEIVASTYGEFEIIHIIDTGEELMLESQTGIDHPSVLDEVAACGIESETELLTATV